MSNTIGSDAHIHSEPSNELNVGFWMTLGASILFLFAAMACLGVVDWRYRVADRYFALIAEHDPQTLDELATALKPILASSRAADPYTLIADGTTARIDLLFGSALDAGCNVEQDGKSISHCYLVFMTSDHVEQDEDGSIRYLQYDNRQDAIIMSLLFALPTCIAAALAGIGLRTHTRMRRMWLFGGALFALIFGGLAAAFSLLLILVPIVESSL